MLGGLEPHWLLGLEVLRTKVTFQRHLQFVLLYDLVLPRYQFFHVPVCTDEAAGQELGLWCRQEKCCTANKLMC